MAESKEPVEELEPDLGKANSKPASSGDAETEDLAEQMQSMAEENSGASDSDGDMDLSELEAFLDDFNRSLDDDPATLQEEEERDPVSPTADPVAATGESGDELSDAEKEMMAAAAEDPGASVLAAEAPADGEEPLSEAEAEMMAAAAEDPGASVLESGPSEEEEFDSAGEVAAEEAEIPPVDEDELDLAFGETAEEETEEPESAEEEFEELDLVDLNTTTPEASEPPADETPQKTDDEEPPPDFEPVDAEPVEPAPEPSPPPAPAAAPPTAETAPAGKGLLVASLIAGLALLAGGGSGFFVYQLNGEVERLQQRLSEREVAGTDSASLAPLSDKVEQALREVDKLNARLSELAIIIEGPMSHLRESNERSIRNLSARIDKVDAALDAIEKRVAATAAAKPVSAPAVPPAQKDSGWAVNLVSLSNRRMAEEEQRRLARQGIETRLSRATVDGRSWYRLQVDGFASKADAEAFLQRIRSIDGLEGAWVTR